jgi:hypothetical protein
MLDIQQLMSWVQCMPLLDQQLTSNRTVPYLQDMHVPAVAAGF